MSLEQLRAICQSCGHGIDAHQRRRFGPVGACLIGTFCAGDYFPCTCTAFVPLSDSIRTSKEQAA